MELSDIMIGYKENEKKKKREKNETKKADGFACKMQILVLAAVDFNFGKGCIIHTRK